VEYAGDLISWSEAHEREAEYSLNPQIGCYMYYFSARGNNYWYVSGISVKNDGLDKH